jgi:hypothetical protein
LIYPRTLNKLLAASSREGMTWIWRLDTGTKVMDDQCLGGRNSILARLEEAHSELLDRRVGIQKVPLPRSSSVKFPPTATLIFGTMIVAAFTFKVSQVITTP